MNSPLARPLAEVDPAIHELILRETRRQDRQIELIASENFTSEAVLEATASVFTNKYAEGYPGKRYYGGCEYTDVVENLARERARKLFGAEYVNVQPHSGSQANQAAYASVLTPGDVIMGLILAREQYGKEIDKNVFPGTQGGPLVHVMAAKAVCFLEAMQPEFVAYQKQVVANARALAQSLMDAGFRVVSGGTDTHVVLLDVF